MTHRLYTSKDFLPVRIKGYRANLLAAMLFEQIISTYEEEAKGFRFKPSAISRSLKHECDMKVLRSVSDAIVTLSALDPNLAKPDHIAEIALYLRSQKAIDIGGHDLNIAVEMRKQKTPFSMDAALYFEHNYRPFYEPDALKYNDVIDALKAVLHTRREIVDFGISQAAPDLFRRAYSTIIIADNDVEEAPKGLAILPFKVNDHYALDLLLNGFSFSLTRHPHPSAGKEEAKAVGVLKELDESSNGLLTKLWGILRWANLTLETEIGEHFSLKGNLKKTIISFDVEYDGTAFDLYKAPKFEEVQAQEPAPLGM